MGVVADYRRALVLIADRLGWLHQVDPDLLAKFRSAGATSDGVIGRVARGRALGAEFYGKSVMRRKSSLLSVGVVLVGVVLLGIPLAATLYRVETTFSITAVTEILRVETGSVPMPSWRLHEVSLVQGYESGVQQFTGSLWLNPDVEVFVERVSTGPLRILCRSLTAEGSVGTIYDPDGTPLEALGNRVVVEIEDPAERAENGESIVIPLVGELEIGRSVSLSGSSETALLRSGTVSLIGRSLWSSALYVAHEVVLDAGDHFQVEEPATAAYGLIIVDERPGMTAVFRVRGKNGVVSRFGSRGYPVVMPILSRLVADKTLQGIWLTVLALVGLAYWIAERLKGRETT